MELTQMESLQGGVGGIDGKASCGEALVIGSFIGGMFGGIGALVGIVGVAVSGNCLNWI